MIDYLSKSTTYRYRSYLVIKRKYRAQPIKEIHDLTTVINILQDHSYILYEYA